MRRASVLLLFHGVRVLLDHLDPLYSPGVGPAQGFLIYLRPEPVRRALCAALVITGLIEGKAGVAGLLRRCVQVRAGWQWYLSTLLGIPALLVLGTIVLPGA